MSSERLLFEFDGIEIVEDLDPVKFEDVPYPFRYRVGGIMGFMLFRTKSRAVAEGIAAKYCGHPSAGGTGVDTAGAWFAKMIGMEES